MMATTTAAPAKPREHMDLVIVGHVDHGKSTVIGRLMADTGSLPKGKLEQVKAMCERNARPFEYAFLLDALKAEQAQGITIDTARAFFNTARRRYIINDAPGHIEFLKNMVTGAARAEAALLVIDAEEGVRENSKRHGFLVSMLGLKQLAVLVNKMDLVGFSAEVFDRIRSEYEEFLSHVGAAPLAFIPVSAREGENIAVRSEKMPWYKGPTVLEQVDLFERPSGVARLAFRMPVQDIYKFTDQGDDRRIIAGTVSSGSIKVGDRVVFYPSQKETAVASIEGFNAPPRNEIGAGWAAGFTITEQIYIKPGEMMCKAGEIPEPHVGRRFRASMFWMGRPPMVKGKSYRLKIGAMNASAELAGVVQSLDASELGTVLNKQQIDRHDVAECIIETARPIAFDLRNDLEPTGRFVIVDDYEIAGCGVILEALGDAGSVLAEHVREREFHWERGPVTHAERAMRTKNSGKLVIIHGVYGCGKRRVAKHLERTLFDRGHNAYYFGISNYFEELDRDVHTRNLGREQHLERLGDLARVVTDTGALLITTVTDADDFDLEKLKLLNAPTEIFVVNVGEKAFNSFPVDVELPYRPDLDAAVEAIIAALRAKAVVFD